MIETLHYLPCNHQSHFKCIKDIFKFKGSEIKCSFCNSKFQSKDIMIPGNIINLNEEKNELKALNTNLSNLKQGPLENQKEQVMINLGRVVPKNENLEYPNLDKLEDKN